jgi:RNA polymerase sigma factor (sigma-70 family)
MDFLRLQREYLPKLYRNIGDRDLADEMFQVTVVKALRSWPDKNDDELTRLLPITMRRSLLHFLRGERNRKRREHMVAKPEVLREPMDSDLQELTERLRESFSRLPREGRDVLHLAYFEDRSNAEIAAMLGITLGNVKTRRRRALIGLRELLDVTGSKAGDRA